VRVFHKNAQAAQARRYRARNSPILPGRSESIVRASSRVFWPPGRLLFVTELGAAVPPREVPVDSGLTLIHSAVRGLDLAAQRFQIGDSSFAETLPREDANFDLRLIEPTAVVQLVPIEECKFAVARSSLTA
jgi:hypothetical protein